MIEQAFYQIHPSGGGSLVEPSPGFLPTWTPLVARLFLDDDGPRDGALFALPLGRGQIVIVEAASARYRVLVLPQMLYEDLGADPFWIAEQCQGDAPFTIAPAPERTVAMLLPILKRDDSALLLGGAQVLLDGSRLKLSRSGPAREVIAALWQLLPLRSRAEMWPCTWTSKSRPEFHIQAAHPSEPLLLGALTEDQAADYPEGRYELALQSAIESGDEPELARLLARRSRSQMLWLAVALLVLFSLVPLAGFVAGLIPK